MAATAPIVVIGGGTAGCTVVSYLAAHTTRDIIVIEPGAISSTDDESHFYDALSLAGVTRSRKVSVSGDREIEYRDARALGGGSAINGMLLTGDEPEHLRGLTRMATSDDCGVMGELLLKAGGEFSRLWWNRGRWNPGRAVQHLMEEGRVRVVADDVQDLQFGQRRIASVITASHEIDCDQVVLCAGAIGTPELLLRSGCGEINTSIGQGLSNHPSITVPFSLLDESVARFDASVIYRHMVDKKGEIQMFAFERASHTEARLGLVSIALMNPDSTGAVTIVEDVCSVDFNTLSTARDQEYLTKGVEELLNVISRVETIPEVRLAEPLLGQFSLPEFESTDHGERISMVKSHVEVLSHASGSCTKAVDSKGNLLAFDGVTVADASILSLPNCTPAAPVTMEALRIARILGEELS